MDQSSQRQVLEMTCPNGECGCRFKMYKPEKPGTVKVTCPKCKQSIMVRIDAEVSDNSSAEEKTVTMEPNSEDVYRFACPHCSQQAIGIAAKGRNLLAATCPKCKGRIKLVVDRPAPPTELETDTDMMLDEFPGFGDSAAPKINAVLRVFTKRRFLPDVKTDFPIVKGTYFIGRADPDNQPDIPLSGDTTVSRRSVQIEVIKSQQSDESLYPFTVIKATNPVTVNGKRLRAGESVFLNFNDKITMGKTELVFMRGSHK